MTARPRRLVVCLGTGTEVGKTWEVGINYKNDGVFEANDALRIKADYFHNNVKDYIEGADIDAGLHLAGTPVRAVGSVTCEIAAVKGSSGLHLVRVARGGIERAAVGA